MKDRQKNKYIDRVINSMMCIWKYKSIYNERNWIRCCLGEECREGWGKGLQGSMRQFLRVIKKKRFLSDCGDGFMSI